MQASKGPSSVQVKGAANFELDSPSVAISNVKVSRRMDVMDGELTIVPSYNVAARKVDVNFAYEMEDTIVELDVAPSKQILTVSQRLGDNVVTPSITTDGEFDLQYRRSLPSGSLTATYKPNDSVEVEWEDGPWQATVTTPMDGFYKADGFKINFRRNVVLN